MKRIKDKAFDLIFWLIISLALSALFIVYSLQTKIDLIVLAFSPITIYIIYFAGALIGKKETFKLKMTNKYEFLMTNLLFFIIFIGSLFLISNVFTYLKIGLFVVMILVGWYSIVTFRRSNKNILNK